MGIDRCAVRRTVWRRPPRRPVVAGRWRRWRGLALAPLVGLTLIPGCNTPGPQAGAMTVATIPGRPTPIQLVGFNTDNTAVTFRLSTTTKVTHGTLTGTPPNLTYTAAAGYYGPDSFEFIVTAQGPRTATATAKVTINVKRPNIVVVMSDDQTAQQQEHLPWTNLLLDREGTNFSDFVVSYSECCPSRATFLTGQYSQNHGVLSSSLNTGGVTKFNDKLTLATQLQKAGYHTALTGKYLNGYGEDLPATTVPPGWDDWFGLVDPHGYDFFNYQVSDNGTIVSHGSAPEDYSTDVVFGRAEKTIRDYGRSPQPFFVMVTPTAPHAASGQVAPVPAPRHAGMFTGLVAPQTAAVTSLDMETMPPWIQNAPAINMDGIDNVYRLAARSLQAVDDGVQRLYTALRDTAELDNTVFVYTSDNGYHYGDHGVGIGKSDQYDETLRVPLLVRGPGFPVGRTATQPVANVDLAPTLAAVAGVDLGRVPDGFDLRAFARDPAYGPYRPVLIRNGPLWGRRTWEGVRDSRWTYVESRTGSTPTVYELYDRVNDPYETKNVYGGTSADVKLGQWSSAAALGVLRTCAGTTCQKLK